MGKEPSSIKQYIEDHFDLLKKMLQIANPPGEEEEMRDLLIEELRGLSARVKIDSTGNLIGMFGSDESPAFLLGGHMDSVMPCRGVKVVRKGDVIKSDGTTTLTADNGVGMFEVLMAIRYVQEKNIKVPSIDVLFTVGEEIGGVGVQGLDIYDLRARHGMLLDRADNPGSFVIAGPYKRNFKATFEGIAAHAFEAEKGVSAIHMAADCISQFPQGKIHDKLYANIGIIRGGNAVNQVAERADIEGEVRAFSTLDAEKLLEQYEKIMQEVQHKYTIKGEFEPRIHLEFTERREGYQHSPELPLVKILCDLHEELGIETDMQITRACSDAGDLTQKGIATINYGNGAHRVHTRDEWFDMNDTAKVVTVLVQLLERVGKDESVLSG